MSKPTITKLFIGSVIGLVAGIVLLIGARLGAYDGDAFTMDANKVWFFVVLLTGIFSLDFIGMFIYVIGAPDADVVGPPRRAAMG